MSNLTPRINQLEHNKIINGNFDFWQRGASITPILDSTITYLADRFALLETGTGSLDYDRDTDVPDEISNYSAKITVNTSGTTTANQIADFQYKVEGHDMNDLTNDYMTLSFNVKSSVAGTYCVSFRNGAGSISYVAEYTIDSPNTWENKTITLLHSNGLGVWDTENGAGLIIGWTLSSGATLQTTPGVWTGADRRSTVNQTDFVSNPGATFKLSQVQLNKGEAAGSFSRAGRTIGGELQLCQRYYEKNLPLEIAPGLGSRGNGSEEVIHFRGNVNTTSTIAGMVYFKVKKRANPSITLWSPNSSTDNTIYRGSAVASSITQVGTNSFHGRSVSGATVADVYFDYKADAEL